MTKHPPSLPFLDPVDSSIESYHKIIENPMILDHGPKHEEESLETWQKPKGSKSSKRAAKGRKSGNQPDKNDEKPHPRGSTNLLYKKSAFLGDLRLIFRQN